MEVPEIMSLLVTMDGQWRDREKKIERLRETLRESEAAQQPLRREVRRLVNQLREMVGYPTVLWQGRLYRLDANGDFYEESYFPVEGA